MSPFCFCMNPVVRCWNDSCRSVSKLQVLVLQCQKPPHGVSLKMDCETDMIGHVPRPNFTNFGSMIWFCCLRPAAYCSCGGETTIGIKRASTRLPPPKLAKFDPNNASTNLMLWWLIYQPPPCRSKSLLSHTNFTKIPTKSCVLKMSSASLPHSPSTFAIKPSISEWTFSISYNVIYIYII